MRESYERIRMKTNEIMDLFKKKAIEDDIFDGADPELAILLMGCYSLLKAYDNFTLACIGTMEDQSEKLDRILNMLNRREAP